MLTFFPLLRWPRQWNSKTLRESRQSWLKWTGRESQRDKMKMCFYFRKDKSFSMRRYICSNNYSTLPCHNNHEMWGQVGQSNISMCLILFSRLLGSCSKRYWIWNPVSIIFMCLVLSPGMWESGSRIDSIRYPISTRFDDQRASFLFTIWLPRMSTIAWPKREVF